MIRVGVCCTFGVGSSMMLKMNLETAFRNMQIEADIEVSDIASVQYGNYELIFTSESLADQVEESLSKKIDVMPVVDYFDIDGLEKLIKKGMGEN